jgi:hypothetical protein
MKRFYIETDLLTTAAGRTLRYIYEENANGQVFLREIVDPATKEEFAIDDIKKDMSHDLLLSMQTAHHGNFEKHYF